MTAPVLVGIHGLNNKPPAPVLAAWWAASLHEGLARNLGLGDLQLDFRLAYWADLLHAAPVPPDDDPAPYTEAPGEGALPRARTGLRRRMAAWGYEAAGKVAEAVASAPPLEAFIEDLVNARANDLFRYHTEAGLRVRVRQRLEDQLAAAAATRCPVVLIAHSMGSIIAYDVLRQHPCIAIAHLVTIGSPLGLAEIKAHATREFGTPVVPAGVAQWTNLSDPRDPVAAFDVRLRSDYGPNASGVQITDASVMNTYVSPLGRANPHKVYGYLRAPEMSALLVQVLGDAENQGGHS